MSAGAASQGLRRALSNPKIRVRTNPIPTRGISAVSSLRAPGTRISGHWVFSITRTEMLVQACSVKRRRVAPIMIRSAPTSWAVLMIACAGSSPSTRRTEAGRPRAVSAADQWIDDPLAPLLQIAGSLRLGLFQAAGIVVEQRPALLLVEGRQKGAGNLHHRHHRDASGVVGDQEVTKPGDRGRRQHPGCGYKNVHRRQVRRGRRSRPGQRSGCHNGRMAAARTTNFSITSPGRSPTLWSSSGLGPATSGTP